MYIVHKQVVMAMQSDQAISLVYSVDEVAKMLGLSKYSAYEAAKRGDIPTIRIGKLIKVPKVAFHRMFERVLAEAAE